MITNEMESYQDANCEIVIYVLLYNTLNNKL